MPPRKFSTLIKQMIVELDRDMHLYPEGNIVEVSNGRPNERAYDTEQLIPSGREPPTSLSLMASPFDEKGTLPQRSAFYSTSNSNQSSTKCTQNLQAY